MVGAAARAANSPVTRLEPSVSDNLGVRVWLVELLIGTGIVAKLIWNPGKPLGVERAPPFPVHLGTSLRMSESGARVLLVGKRPESIL